MSTFFENQRYVVNFDDEYLDRRSVSNRRRDERGKGTRAKWMALVPRGVALSSALAG